MKPQCGAKTRSGGQCKKQSGWGTDHVGEGRCKLHGGNAGRPVQHGRYSLVHRASLREKAEKYFNDSSPGDLTGELALMRALLQDYLERFPDEMPLSLKNIQNIYGMLDQVTKTVERIARILNQTALTQAELHVLQARLADVVIKYVPLEHRNAFFSELGTGTELGTGGLCGGSAVAPIGVGAEAGSR
jgi:hypothetical protein